MSPPLLIEKYPSPNHGERAAGKPTDMLLLHYTGMASAERALRWLCDPESGVSCHYFVFEDGRIAQLVDEDRRAWHAGSLELGRRDRHQLALDRDRDRQSGPPVRLPRVSG